jgi:hypothetical protein
MMPNEPPPDVPAVVTSGDERLRSPGREWRAGSAPRDARPIGSETSMKRDRSMLWIVVGMIAASAILYGIEFAAYHEPQAMLARLLAELAFLPIHALVVVLVFEGLLARRDKAAMMHKLYMVIGAFFSEAGTDLLERLTRFDEDLADLAPSLVFTSHWKPADFNAARKAVEAKEHPLSFDTAGLVEIREFLTAKRPLLLGLLENANLLEYEGFTEMLWALTHLSEELAARHSLDDMPTTDAIHIQGDIARVYGGLLVEWLRYVEHLKTDYPYLYSFAARTNPFDPKATVVVSS